MRGVRQRVGKAEEGAVGWRAAAHERGHDVGAGAAERTARSAKAQQLAPARVLRRQDQEKAIFVHGPVTPHDARRNVLVTMADSKPFPSFCDLATASILLRYGSRRSHQTPVSHLAPLICHKQQPGVLRTVTHPATAQEACGAQVRPAAVERGAAGTRLHEHERCGRRRRAAPWRA